VTRRIAVGVTLLVAALLIGVALPLVLTTASADRQQFRAGALSSARMTAAAAEEQLADPTDQPGGGRPHLLAAPGDRVVVLARTGRRVAAAGDPAPRPPAALLRGALAGRSGTAWRGADDGRRLLVAVPVGAADRLHGAVVLDRPAASLDSQLERLYARAGTAAAAAVLLAVTLGALLVRWLTKPIVTLERAALDLGNGHLDRRAPVRGGPPELRRLATAFNAMAGRLHTLLDAHRTVIADVSHQLRTPLAALRLRLELLEDDAEPTIAADITDALAELARLSRLLDGLLAVARAENTSLPRAPTRIAHVVGGRIDAWAPLAAERSINLTARIPEQVVATTTPGHLEQIIDNLIANALDATPPGGSITVSAGVGGNQTRIAVADTGPGMPEQQRTAAFQRFGSGRSDTGTGLGLAIVDRLVKADLGDLDLDQTAGGGLTVNITLPAATPADVAPDQGPQQPTATPSDTTSAPPGPTQGASATGIQSFHDPRALELS